MKALRQTVNMVAISKPVFTGSTPETPPTDIQQKAGTIFASRHNLLFHYILVKRQSAVDAVSIIAKDGG